MDRMILAPQNTDVGDLNRRMLGLMSGEEEVFLSVDSVVDEASADDGSQMHDTFPEEFLCTLNLSGLPPGELRLKTGCPIILLRNLCPSQGLCKWDMHGCGSDFKKGIRGKGYRRGASWGNCLHSKNYPNTHRRPDRLCFYFEVSSVPGESGICADHQQGTGPIGQSSRH